MANYTLNYTGEKVDELLNKIDTAFGETTVMGDTLTWDGDITGKPVVSLDMGEDGVMNFCKVSNAVPTIEDLSGGVTVTLPGMGTNSLPADALTSGDGYIGSEIFLFISKPNATVEGMGLTFPETGTWLVQQSAEGMSVYVSEITIPNYTGFERTGIKTIDEKYIPIKKKTYYIEDPSKVTSGIQPHIYTDEELTVKATPQEVYDAYITCGVLLEHSGHKFTPVDAYCTTNGDMCSYIRTEVLYGENSVNYKATLLE